MLLPPIHINPVIFALIIIEISIFWHQFVSYLARPHEKRRLWQVIFIGLLILYNLAENLVSMPDKHIPLPTVIQNIISESFGYFITAYIPFYCYKTLDLPHLRFHARYGFLFVVLPAVYFFFIFYPIYHDLLQTRRYVYIIPGIYALWALSVTGYAVLKNYQEDKNRELFHERLWIFIAVVFWCTQPLVGAFGGAPKWIVGIFGNINFLVLNALFMHQTIKRTKADYQRLQESNITLTEKVTEGTRKIKKLAKEIEDTFNDQLTEYINKHGITDELNTVKGNINKITFDMVNLFNLERFVTVNAIQGASNFDFNPKEEAAINKFEQNCQAYSLTPRETNIAKLVCQGFSYKIIGENLFIAERTVKKHVQNIFRKVNVSNKIQLINKLEI